MKIAAFALAAAVLTAGSSVAADRVTDVEFMKAHRCKGLATSITGVVDPAGLDAFIKAERGSRAFYVSERATEEFNKAKKEGRSADRRERLTAELAGPCQAYLPGGSAMAKQ